MITTTKQLIVGIDPGMSGGISVYYNNKLSFTSKFPSTPAELMKLFYEEAGLFEARRMRSICYMEDVHAMPHDAKKAIFTFAKNVGWLEMALTGLIDEIIKISPMKWQKYFEMQRRKDESKHNYKNRLKDLAINLTDKKFHKQITLSTADAVLIGLYGVNDQKNENENKNEKENSNETKTKKTHIKILSKEA